MTSAEYKQLFEETSQQVNDIRDLAKDIVEIKNSCQKASEEIISDTGFLKQINNIADRATKLQEDIERVYKNVCVSTKEETSYEDLIDEAYKDIDTKQKQVAKYAKELFWAIEQWVWEETKIPWFAHKIEDFFEKNKKKMEDLIKDAETRLAWSATSVELAETFSTKVQEYKKSGSKWSGGFWVIMIIIIGYYMYVTRNNADASSLGQVWVLLLYRLPLIGFCIWLLGFIWNRRAEAKKLEESYKHKEVLARSYVWYRRSVEELSTADNKLLEELMANLLKAINHDSGSFLQLEWEKHPFFNLLGVFWNKDKADPNQDSGR